jgi:hypothetical protein
MVSIFIAKDRGSYGVPSYTIPLRLKAIDGVLRRL